MKILCNAVIGCKPISEWKKRKEMSDLSTRHRQTLEAYPGLPASRMNGVAARHGYAGSEASIRRKVAELRPRKPSEAFLRPGIPPGAQTRFDRADFCVARRKLHCFFMMPGYSRMRCPEFFPESSMKHFLSRHVGAFGGVSRSLLCDNWESAPVERRRKAVELNSTAAAMPDR